MRVKFGLLALGAMGLVLGCGTAQAHHNDWAAPLVGGALGGYALSSLVHSSEASSKPTTTYVEPAYVAPAYVAPAPVYTSGTASTEARLRELDALAANGYITHQEYEQRRQAILNQALGAP